MHDLIIAKRRIMQVKLFRRVGALAFRDLEGEVNNWLREDGDNIKVLDRQFSVSAVGETATQIIAIAIWYEEKGKAGPLF